MLQRGASAQCFGAVLQRKRSATGLLRSPGQSQTALQHLQQKRLSHTRMRLRELKRVCPHITEEMIEQHGLRKISWAVRRVGKSTPQGSLPRSAAVQTHGSVEKGTAPDDGAQQFANDFQ